MFLERWFWYFSDAEVEGRLKNTETTAIGIVRGSAQAAWLENLQFQKISIVDTQEQLLLLLGAGRIDAFISDMDHLGKIIASLPIDTSFIRSKFIKYAPMGVYFANAFLDNKPDFLSEFNASIYQCSREKIPFYPEEIEKIDADLGRHILRLLDDARVQESIFSANVENWLYTNEDIQQLDEQWVKEVKRKSQPLIESIRSKSISTMLKNVQKASAGLLTEIFVTDKNGVIVGLSQATSDYWQRDEPELQNIAGFKKTLATTVILSLISRPDYFIHTSA